MGGLREVYNDIGMEYVLRDGGQDNVFAVVRKTAIMVIPNFCSFETAPPTSSKRSLKV